MGREELMRKIHEYGFAAFEWNLYLDTHPCDRNALQMHQKMAQAARELTMQYEQQYGPLTAAANTATDTWDWVNEPWPWEGGGK